MNNRAQILRAIEDFLYESCLLIVFYPWYLLRIIVRPGSTLREYRDRFLAGQGDDLVISPPIFLMITASVTALIFPKIDFGNRVLFSQFARLVSADATLARIVATLMPVLVLAICSALVIEWRTPGGVTRESFQLPLFLSVLVSSVLLIVITLASLALDGVNADDLSPIRAISGMIVIFGGLGWYLFAQSEVFMLLTGSGRLAAVAWSAVAFAMNEAVTSLLPQG